MAIKLTAYTNPFDERIKYVLTKQFCLAFFGVNHESTILEFRLSGSNYYSVKKSKEFREFAEYISRGKTLHTYHI